MIVGEVGVPFTAARGKEDLIRKFTADFLEFCLTYRDAEVGNPNDDQRVVQKIVWFLLSPPKQPMVGFSDNPSLDLKLSSLMDHQGKLTPLGETFATTIRRIESQARDEKDLSEREIR